MHYADMIIEFITAMSLVNFLVIETKQTQI